MLKNIKLPKIIKSFLSGVNESEKKATQKKVNQILEEDRKIIEAQNTDNPISIPKDTSGEKRKSRHKTKLFRLTGVSAAKQVFFRPMVMPSVQIECEKWWFAKSTRARDKIISNRVTGNNFRARILRLTLKLGEKEKPSYKGLNIEDISSLFVQTAKDEAVRYWPILMIFGMVLIVYIINIKLQSGLMALLGFFFCLLILWQCRFIKVKRSLGLKYFCPFATLFIQSAYIAETEQKAIKKQCRKIKTKQDK